MSAIGAAPVPSITVAWVKTIGDVRGAAGWDCQRSTSPRAQITRRQRSAAMSPPRSWIAQSNEVPARADDQQVAVNRGSGEDRFPERARRVHLKRPAGTDDEQVAVLVRGIHVAAGANRRRTEAARAGSQP